MDKVEIESRETQDYEESGRCPTWTRDIAFPGPQHGKRLLSTTCTLVLALVGWFGLGGVVSADQGAANEWMIFSPADGHVFTSRLLYVPIQVRQPANAFGVLRVTVIGDNGLEGEATNHRIPRRPDATVALDNSGKPLPDGRYRLELFEDSTMKRLKALSSFEIRDEGDAINLPTIELPHNGHEYPAGTTWITFTGNGTSKLYIAIKRYLRPVGVLEAEANDYGYWILDAAWTWGGGGYHADLFLAHPSRLRTIAEDGTTFQVGGEGTHVRLPTDWKSYLPQQR